MNPYLTLETPLDGTVKRDRKFSLQHLTGSEGLCLDFSYRLAVCSLERLTPDELETLTGNSVTVKIAYADDRQKESCRYLNGIVYQVKEVGRSRTLLLKDLWRYELTIGSWLTQLGFVKECRIIQKVGNTTLKIIMELLRELGCHDFENKTKGNFPRREYAALYNESILDFIKRLTREEGILWYFKHAKNKHLLVFNNDSTSLPQLESNSWSKQDAMKSFCREIAHSPLVGYTTAAYDPDNPPVKTIQRNTGEKKGSLKHFEYPGGFVQRAEGEQQAVRSVNALKHRTLRYFGESTVRMMQAGHQFELFAPLLKDLHQKRYLVQALEIEATATQYRNRLVVVPAKDPYFLTPAEAPAKPVIYGSQTATVVGEAGPNKVQTDKKGRVKVRFHWDHHAAQNATNASAFVRVAGPCAGSQRGFLFTPRVGEEVSVSFEDGDPDKPLITGSFYANEHKPAAAPNSKPYRSIIKTGNEADANRITLDDSPGSEKLEMQAKKDLNITVGGHLDIDVEDDITIHANKVTVIIRKNIILDAGGNIINLTLKSIKESAGTDINNMAIGGVINAAGGLVTNLAGKTLTNTAILFVENTSAGGIKETAKTLLANTAINAVAFVGPKVENKGNLAMTNISKGGIINDAKDVKTDTLFQKVKIKEGSITETGGFKIKGLLSKIN